MAEATVPKLVIKQDPNEVEPRVQQKHDAPGGSFLKSLMEPENIKVGVYLSLWWLFSVTYNLYNKWASKALLLPWFVASFQLFIGVPIICFVWATGIRKAPSVFNKNLFLKLVVIAVFHCLTHFAAVLSMNLGAVSFTHIIKASEPVFTAMIVLVWMGTLYTWQVYATLVCVVLGISLASVQELSFSWMALLYALMSALAASMRGISSKQALQDVPAEKHLQAQNLYAVLTILASIMALVPLLIVEGSEFSTKMQVAFDAHGVGTCVWYLLASGLSYYLYNELAFLALESIAPVTHAVSSTFKRVFIIGASVVILNHPITALGYVGCAFAIISVFLYSIAKKRYPARVVSPKSVASKAADSKV